MRRASLRRTLRMMAVVCSPRVARESRLIRASGLFDEEYYSTSYPDVPRAGFEPLAHFLRHGAREGRNPNRLFDTTFYAQGGPAAATGSNPLVHFILHGLAENRRPCPGFDPAAYLDRHPELRQSGENPLSHALRHGWSAESGDGDSGPDAPDAVRPLPRAERDRLVLEALAASSGVIHAGAHFGEEAPTYGRSGLPVIWVEAHPDTYRKLVDRVGAYREQTALCALLGSVDGVTRPFFVSSNNHGASSSVFEFGPFGTGESSLWPELDLHTESEVTLESRTLDSILHDAGVERTEYDFLALDVQGAELEALQGASDVLQAVRFVYAEASTVEVYRGGALWPDLKRFLNERGFVERWSPTSSHEDVLFERGGGWASKLPAFHTEARRRLAHRRLEHLASFALPVAGREVLLAGATLGEPLSFFLDRGCRVMAVDMHERGLAALREQFADHPNVRFGVLDPRERGVIRETFDVVYCCLPLHRQPDLAAGLASVAERCRELLIVDAHVSLEGHTHEGAATPEVGHGWWRPPTRARLTETVGSVMPHVYHPGRQPAHPAYAGERTQRAVLMATRTALEHPDLST